MEVERRFPDKAPMENGADKTNVTHQQQSCRRMRWESLLSVSHAYVCVAESEGTDRIVRHVVAALVEARVPNPPSLLPCSHDRSTSDLRLLWEFPVPICFPSGIPVANQFQIPVANSVSELHA